MFLNALHGRSSHLQHIWKPPGQTGRWLCKAINTFKSPRGSFLREGVDHQTPGSPQEQILEVLLLQIIYHDNLEWTSAFICAPLPFLLWSAASPFLTLCITLYIPHSPTPASLQTLWSKLAPLISITVTLVPFLPLHAVTLILLGHRVLPSSSSIRILCMLYQHQLY